ncbi:ribonuclease H [Lactiplantibacillus plantarum]|uniref:ribonuclease H n=1 Tax=Lactiplantibacillus plantarum TaxID=1590 RepID=UPI0040358653
MATIHLYLASTNHQSTNITATTPAAWVVILRYADHQKTLNDGGYGHTETSLALSALTTALATLKRHDLPVHIHTTTEQVAAVISEQRYLSWRQNNWDVPEADQPDLPQWQTLIPIIEKFPNLTITYPPVDDPAMTTATTTLTAVMTKL